MDDLQVFLAANPIAPQETQFLPAERAPDDKLAAQVWFFGQHTGLDTFVNAVPDVYLVLNEERQIVFANERMREWIDCDSFDDIAGLRVGEALDCVHADKLPGGCGTTEFCQTCGAALAILASQKGANDVRECRIMQKNGNALDLRVWTTPSDIEDTRYTIFSVHNIADEKRRRVLERIFFHDILNTAGVLRGISELLDSASADELADLHTLISGVAVKLVDEIQAQRDLAAAEANELSLQQNIIHTREFVQEMASLYLTHPVADGRTIIVSDETADAAFITDKRLLGRVLGNMIKNALEAISDGEAVTIGCDDDRRERVRFWVHNPTAMPKNVRLQIFQRSFSTKGEGRGLGTYSIKLLTERYMGGKVWFTTDKTDGTTFFVEYPLQHL